MGDLPLDSFDIISASELEKKLKWSRGHHTHIGMLMLVRIIERLSRLPGSETASCQGACHGSLMRELKETDYVSRQLN